MAHVRLNDDAIWVRGIEGDATLREHLLALSPGETTELEVDGIVGTWERMRDGRDGRPTKGIRPVGPMRQAWKAMQSRRGELLPVRRVARVDPYLALVQSTLEEEWNSPEDDEAFRDL